MENVHAPGQFLETIDGMRDVTEKLRVRLDAASKSGRSFLDLK